MKTTENNKLTEAQKRDNLATFGVEDPSTIKIDEENPMVKKMTKEELEKKEPLDTPTFFSTQTGKISR